MRFFSLFASLCTPVMLKHSSYSAAAAAAAVVAAFLFSATSVVAVDHTTNAADGGGDTELSAKVRAHLSMLTTLSDGGPNPRVTCTDGLWEAGKFIFSR